MRILKFKSQLTIAFFAAVNHRNGPLRKQNFTLTSWLVICDWWISIRFVCFCVSRFVDCDRHYDWRQRKTQLWRRLMNFRVRMFVKSAVRILLNIPSSHLPFITAPTVASKWLIRELSFWCDFQRIFMWGVNFFNFLKFKSSKNTPFRVLLLI